MVAASETAHLQSLYADIKNEIDKAHAEKTYKYEVPIEDEQGGTVTVNGKTVVMLASNNYLGLANHPRVLKAAKEGLEKYGYGLASVRFICGTQPIHRKLEEAIAGFFGTEDAIMHSSCFAANEAFFTALVSG